MDHVARLRHAESIVKEEPDEALKICNQILDKELDSDIGQMALFLSGYIMLSAERFGLAYQIFKRCQQLRPNVGGIWLNMGMCLEQDFPERAIKCFEKALELEKQNTNALANLGLMAMRMGDPKKSIELSNRALQLDPNMIAAKYNRGLAYLMDKNWALGWADYQQTLGVKSRQRRDYGLPEWNGEEETRVLVYAEQGIGDEVMFASCLRDLAKTNEIVFDCDSRLEGIFKQSFCFPVYGTRFKDSSPIMAENKPEYQIAIGQLPCKYRLTDESFPGDAFLDSDFDRTIMWKALLENKADFSVGIAWTGGLPSTGEADRSLTLDDFNPILKHPFLKGANIVNLEYKPVDGKLMEEKGILNYPRAVLKGCDLQETFALINSLDLVICVPTAVMHFAGSLGRPCFVICPDRPPYIMGAKGNDFPWYKSVKLFRGKNAINDILEEVCLKFS